MNKIINTVLLFGILCALIYIGVQLKVLGYELNGIDIRLLELGDS